MKIIPQKVEILSNTDTLLTEIEYAGRNCYNSRDKISPGSAAPFCKMLIEHGHEAMLEFGSVTVNLITSRDVLAELTRHRMVSFAVKSQRYVAEDKTGDVEFIRPLFYKDSNYGIYDGQMIPCDEPSGIWFTVMANAEAVYKELIRTGLKKEDARKVLPNSTATEITMKANVREWRHIFQLRTAKDVYPEMRQLMKMLLAQFKERIPVLFDDIEVSD